jgi:hypothetical protein
MMDESINGRYRHYAISKNLIPVTKGIWSFLIFIYSIVVAMYCYWAKRIYFARCLPRKQQNPLLLSLDARILRQKNVRFFNSIQDTEKIAIKT